MKEYLRAVCLCMATLVAVLFALFAVLAAFALLAMLAVIVIVAVQRFYKNLLGDEGYLMFTLPATGKGGDRGNGKRP